MPSKIYNSSKINFSRILKKYLYTTFKIWKKIKEVSELKDKFLSNLMIFVNDLVDFVVNVDGIFSNTSHFLKEKVEPRFKKEILQKINIKFKIKV